MYKMDDLLLCRQVVLSKYLFKKGEGKWDDELQKALITFP